MKFADALLVVVALALVQSAASRPPARTDNAREYSIDKAMDGDPQTVWLSWGTKPESDGVGESEGRSPSGNKERSRWIRSSSV